MFRPPKLLAFQIVPTAANIPAGRPRLLRPSRTCVVTFARIGYAIRLTTGNWRNEDLHLARFSALSAAPHPCEFSPRFAERRGQCISVSVARSTRPGGCLGQRLSRCPESSSTLAALLARL